MGACNPPSVTGRQEERLRRQAIHHSGVCPLPGLDRLGGEGIAIVELPVERRLGIDRDHARERRNAHEEVPVLEHRQIVGEPDAVVAERTEGNSDRTDRGLVVADVGEQVERGGKRLDHRAGGVAGFAGAFRRPLLNPGACSGNLARVGLDRERKCRQPVASGEIVVVEEADVVARGRLEASVERRSAETRCDLPDLDAGADIGAEGPDLLDDVIIVRVCHHEDLVRRVRLVHERLERLAQ